MKLSEQITGKQEDQIAKFRALIQEFQKITDSYYAELQEKTGIRGKPVEDFLWDFCFNTEEEAEFSDYLAKFGH